MTTGVDMKLGQIGKHRGVYVMRAKEGLVRLEAPFDTLTWNQDSFAPEVEILKNHRFLIIDYRDAVK